MLKVPVINKSNNALPKYATSGSAGFDFCANVTEVKEKLTWNCSLSRNINGKIVEITIYPGGRALIPTGLHMAIPKGYMLAVVTRSGLGLKKGVTMANSFGVIDAVDDVQHHRVREEVVVEGAEELGDEKRQEAARPDEVRRCCHGLASAVSLGARP